jgi:hypothetical protein
MLLVLHYVYAMPSNGVLIYCGRTALLSNSVRVCCAASDCNMLRISRRLLVPVPAAVTWNPLQTAELMTPDYYYCYCCCYYCCCTAYTFTKVCIAMLMCSQHQINCAYYHSKQAM